MSILFEQTRIGSLTMANRFVRSATWEGMADDNGAVTPGLMEVTDQLARGGVGLIITGHAFVSPEGQAGRWQLAAYSDDLLAGLAAMAARAHEGGSKIALQLAHAGSRAPFALTGLEPIGPSVLETDADRSVRAMTADDIEAVAAAFRDAAARALTAGFDAVQIHAAHGYLLSQFLSPYFNKRTDGYGGTIENRARPLLTVLGAIRRVVPPDYPVFVKLNAADFLPGGLTPEEMVLVAMMLEAHGVGAVEMSGGTFLSGKNAPSRQGRTAQGEPEAYYEEMARLYKQRVATPLILVGGIRTIETAERLVAEGLADYISFSRPLIREPDLVNRWKSGDRTPAQCVSDGGCFRPGFQGRGVQCVVKARRKAKR